MIYNYYSQKFIHYLMANYVKNRTMDFIIPRRIDPHGIAFRYRRISSPKGIIYYFEKFNIKDKPFNIYSSVAKIDISKFPLMSMKGSEAREQLKFINEHYAEFVTGYDLKIDIDNEDLKIAHEEASKIKKLLDDNKVPYWVMFSGNKGFNFTVDSRFMPSKYKVTDLPEINLKIVENIKKKLDLPSVDLSVYTLGRVFKVPYGIAREKNLVALPLTDFQFNNFRPEDFTPEEVLRNVKLMNRGLLERPGTYKDVGSFYAKMLGKGIKEKLRCFFDNELRKL